jgi:hypothetical protein
MLPAGQSAYAAGAPNAFAAKNVAAKKTKCRRLALTICAPIVQSPIPKNQVSYSPEYH